MFDPFHLDIDITPETIKHVLNSKDYSTAIMMAFRLNEQSLIQEVVEQVPVDDGNLGYVLRLCFKASF